jgi:glycosyltransferase involved in cell wall biosynthesis
LRVLIFHGYLLAGTGSNVYNARLAEALVALGHEVHLLCQERHPERCAFASAAGDWDGGALRVRELGPSPAGGGGCTLYRPDIGGVLPVYVQDRYEGIEARTFADCSDAEVAAYVQANVAAVRELAERVRPDMALANHLVMGPAILARALGQRVPYAVKVHGSALEYTVKPQPERFLGYAREGLAPAKTVLVGSLHTARSLWRALEDPSLPARTRLGPPGVDVHRFRPREPEQAASALAALVERLRAEADSGQAGASGDADSGQAAAGTDAESGHAAARADADEPASAFARDERAVADALERVLADRGSRCSPTGGAGELVAFVGKLIAAKGVDLLLAAWPLVLRERPRARLLAIGFGSERERFEELAAPLGERIVFTGRLEHDELPDVLPLCEALVVPSTFPEAFGMVAIEAAACGVLPIGAAHSGLAEVSGVLAEAVPAPARSLLSFPIDERAPAAIAERVLGWLAADERLRERTRAALVATVRERWSWEGVAQGVIAAVLDPPSQPDGPLARAVG